ncbi:uncharacterized protein traf3ip3 [Pholidichthys leucotaenia]
MDAPDFREIQLTPMKNFDQLLEIRAEKREHLRGRNNVTSCRSPTHEFDTKLIKNELKDKRHQEFLRRRSVSPDTSSSKSEKHSSKRKNSPRTTLHTNTQNRHNANGQPVMILTTHSTDDPSSSKWASLWSEQIMQTRQEKGQAKKQPSTSTLTRKESDQHRVKGTHKTDINVQKTSSKTFVQIEKIHQTSSLETETILQMKKLRDTGVQTESGVITVKESDIQRLGDYLQEALWREEVVKKKLSTLQESTTNLTNSSNKIWTSRCSEDLLRNKIKALEAQLQVCAQKFPKDGVKKLVLQMEKHRVVYEEKAMVALQKATEEKTEALNKADTLQEALIAVKAEALRWQSLYEKLRLSSGRLRESQQLSHEQLQQLHSQVELSRAREDELGKEVLSLRRERQELQYNISLLEEDNQMLREELQNLRDGDDESQNFVTSEEAEPRLTVRDPQLEEQLCLIQEKLQLKEKECQELQTELHAMEQECQSSQARLSQCRDELRQLSHRRRRATPCSSWLKVFVLLLLLLVVAGAVMLWLWHPPFREQVGDLYSDIETRIEDYLREMASPQHSGCFRPI